MPSESDHKIEELLRACAKKRREEAGAPFELHPATRRLLQAEVARHRPKPGGESPSFFRLLMRFWPRMAFAASAVVAVGLVIWAALPKQSPKTELARLEKKPLELAYKDRDRYSKDAPAAPDAGANRPEPAATRAPSPESKAAETPKAESAKPTEMSLAVTKGSELESSADKARGKELASGTFGRGGGFGGGGGRQASSQSGFGGVGGLPAAGQGIAPNTAPANAALREEAWIGRAQTAEAKKKADFGLSTAASFATGTSTTAGDAQRGYSSFNFVGPASTSSSPVALSAAPTPPPAVVDSLALGANTLAQGRKLALSSPASQVAAKDGLASTAGASPQGQVGLRLAEALTATETLARKPQALSAVPLAPAATPAPAPLAKEAETVNQLQRLADEKSAVADLDSAGLSKQLARSDATKGLGVMRSRFSQITGPPQADRAKFQNGPILLNSFELEQNGDRVRIYEADGSVYDGQVTVSADRFGGGRGGANVRATASQGNAFQARGTNRSLNQLVVIDGTLVSATEAEAKAETEMTPQGPAAAFNMPAPVTAPPQSPASAPGRRAVAPSQARGVAAPAVLARDQAQPGSPAAVVLRVQGHAKVGGSNEVEINAIRAPSR